MNVSLKKNSYPPVAKEPEAFTQLKAKLAAREPGPPTISVSVTAWHILNLTEDAEKLLQRRHDWMHAFHKPRELRMRNVFRAQRQIDMRLSQARYLAEHLALVRFVRFVAAVRIQRTILKLLYKPASRPGQVPKISRSLVEDGFLLLGCGDAAAAAFIALAVLLVLMNAAVVASIAKESLSRTGNLLVVHIDAAGVDFTALPCLAVRTTALFEFRTAICHRRDGERRVVVAVRGDRRRRRRLEALAQAFVHASGVAKPRVELVNARQLVPQTVLEDARVARQRRRRPSAPRAHRTPRAVGRQHALVRPLEAS